MSLPSAPRWHCAVAQSYLALVQWAGPSRPLSVRDLSARLANDMAEVAALDRPGPPRLNCSDCEDSASLQPHARAKPERI